MEFSRSRKTELAEHWILKLVWTSVTVSHIMGRTLCFFLHWSLHTSCVHQRGHKITSAEFLPKMYILSSSCGKITDSSKLRDILQYYGHLKGEDLGIHHSGRLPPPSECLSLILSFLFMYSTLSASDGSRTRSSSPRWEIQLEFKAPALGSSPDKVLVDVWGTNKHIGTLSLWIASNFLINKIPKNKLNKNDTEEDHIFPNN